MGSAAGVLGTLLSDEEAGRAKLTRLAISVGKVSCIADDLQIKGACTCFTLLKLSTRCSHRCTAL